MAWPTTPVPTTHCDDDADSPTDFRADLVQLITDHNTMVAARNAVSGIPALDGDSKIPIAQLPTGTGSNQAAIGDHVHTGTYEPANADLVDHLTDDTNPHAVTAAQVGADLTTATAHAATGKATPVDADELPLLDSAASFGLKKLTWANLKATAKTYLDTLYALTGHDHAATYAPLAKGVTNGNSHDHVGGDGGTVAYSSLGGLPTLGTAAAKNIPASGNASATQVVYGSDTRLSNARTPVSHTHAETEIVDGALLARLAANETVTGEWTFSDALTVQSLAVLDDLVATGTVRADTAFLQGCNAVTTIRVGASEANRKTPLAEFATVGTPSPGYANLSCSRWSNNATQGASVFLAKSASNTWGVQTALGDDNNLGSVAWAGSDGTDFFRSCVISGVVDGTVSAGVVPGKLEFSVHGTSGSAITPLTIRADGTIEATGTVTAAGGFSGKHLGLDGSTTYDFASLAGNRSASTTVTVTGAALGDFALVSCSSALEAGLNLSGYVSATNTVTVILDNTTAAAIDTASRTYYARVLAR